MRMLRMLAIALLAVLPLEMAQAQTQPITGSISTATPGVGNCVSARAQNNSIVGIDVSGTWTGTLQPTVQILSTSSAPTRNKKVTPLDSTTAQATITGNGSFKATVAGFTQVNVCASAFSSGTAIVTLYAMNGSDSTLTAAAGGGAGTGSCTNQVVTALTNGGPTCTTVTSAYVDTSLAQTGVDINTSNQVTATHLTLALPVAQGGTGNTAAFPLLSALFSDATAAAATRGDGIFAIGATPKWTHLAHPSATGGYFKWNGTDIVGSTGAASGTGTCTNQVATVLNADAAPTCTTLTSAYVDSSIAAGITTFEANLSGTNATLATTQNNVTCWGLNFPLGVLTGHLGYAVATADNSANSYDLGVYTAAGALIVHTGPTAGTTMAPSTGFKRIAFTGTGTVPAGPTLLCLTSSAAAPVLVLGGNTAAGAISIAAANGGTSASATLPANLSAVPAQSFGPTTGNQSIPSIVLEP